MRNQNGFGTLGVIVALVVIASLGFTGWYVWNNQKDDAIDSTTNPTDQTQKSASEGSKYTYKLPESWSEIRCGEKNSETNPEYRLASPDNDKVTDCDDRSNTVLIMVLPYLDEFYDKCLTNEQISEYRKEKPLISYECKETTIDGVRILITKSDHGEGPTIDYTYKGDLALSITYYPNAKGELPYSSQIEEVATSVKFN